MRTASNELRAPTRKRTRRRSAFLTIAAIGVVYGDIGTSPLYAVRESFSGHFGIAPTTSNILGVLSLITWSLMLIVTVKYLNIVLRADNEGEGGILALTALLMPRKREPGEPRRSSGRGRRLLVWLGLFGGALLFGDGMLTPAISVLSAAEGIHVAAPEFSPYVVPFAVAVIAGLFLLQRSGTARVGALFGPISIVWFLTIAALGLGGIMRDWRVLLALNPFYALEFLLRNGPTGLLVLGAVFLVVTGAEALYADMGHFGRGPIRTAWFILVFPALLLNYFGQGALLMADSSASVSPFFLLAPQWALLPVLALATVAAVIASQAIISGVYSLAMQAAQLGFWPRMTIRHTSAHEFGQIYAPGVNFALMCGTIAVVLIFRSSAALAAAYGIAIILTMVVTTILLFAVAPPRLAWPKWFTRLALGFFLFIELGFLYANSAKIADGGWFPLAVALFIFVLALTWAHGREYLGVRMTRRLRPLDGFLEDLDRSEVVRVSGNAIYLTRNNDLMPAALLKNVEHHKALHRRVIVLTVETERIPHVRAGQRLVVEARKHGFYLVTARYGFMDDPDLSQAVLALRDHGLELPERETTYFLGRERLVTPRARVRVRTWVGLFSFMARNSQRATAYFNLPPDRVVEVGSQIEV